MGIFMNKDISLYEAFNPLNGSLPIQIITDNTGDNLRLHWHEQTELLFIEKGNCTIRCDDKNYDVGKGDLVIINPNELHSYNGYNTHTCLIFYPEFFSDVIFERYILKNYIPGDKIISEYISSIANEYKNPTFISNMIIKAKSYELMAYLIKNYTRTQISNVEYDRLISKRRKINNILDYIECHLHENISTSDIAKEFFISETYLCRLFNAELGISPLNHINNMRIQESMVLLKTTNESVSTIAMHLGFSSINYFSRIFKKFTGLTPQEYRKNTK